MTTETKGRVRQRFEDAVLLALNMKEGVMSKGRQGPREAGKDQETGFPQSLHKEYDPASILILVQ